MRTLLISDIHANAAALEAVLRAAGEYERVFCLGDIVGYGPEPQRCIEMVQALPDLTCIMGNHDAALLGLIDLHAFNDEARRAVEVQQAHVNADGLAWLGSLPQLAAVGGVNLAHGSPRNPIWEYIMNPATAQANFGEYEGQICLVGHSHIACIFIEEPFLQPSVLLPRQGDRFVNSRRFILNPGSVGQPRDRNPQASFVIYDDEEQSWLFQRVKYDITAVQRQIVALGIPERHARRLRQGI